ncbi:hypothetical protein [Streptosporangium roseum]|uniref:hypothetical protein n=1 Tax=Streptosporangium roseum TaxID=2001 RepID=UPI0001A3D804|nr:hypothetical protein [Streptosporangium roseum]
MIRPAGFSFACAALRIASPATVRTPATTSITAFRHLPPALDTDRVEALNEAIPAAVQRCGYAFLTGTRLSGVAALRACILHPGTTKDDLTVLLDEIRAAAREVTT